MGYAEGAYYYPQNPERYYNPYFPGAMQRRDMHKGAIDTALDYTGATVTTGVGAGVAGTAGYAAIDPTGFQSFVGEHVAPRVENVAEGATKKALDFADSHDISVSLDMENNWVSGGQISKGDFNMSFGSASETPTPNTETATDVTVENTNAPAPEVSPEVPVTEGAATESNLMERLGIGVQEEVAASTENLELSALNSRVVSFEDLSNPTIEGTVPLTSSAAESTQFLDPSMAAENVETFQTAASAGAGQVAENATNIAATSFTESAAAMGVAGVVGAGLLYLGAQKFRKAGRKNRIEEIM